MLGTIANLSFRAPTFEPHLPDDWLGNPPAVATTGRYPAPRTGAIDDMTFEELNLAPAILKAVLEQGYETPTPIQAQAIPAVLDRA